MTEHAYIHIPFCKRKCNYCAFTSFAVQSYIPKYLEVLTEEIKNNYKNENLKTIYFGGGTPSLLSVEQIKTILALFKYDNSTEITLEINPETIDTEYLKALKNETSINRLSIGVQTFDNKKLKEAGRLHSAESVFETVKQAKELGFNNISIDLIYGLPEQNIRDVEKDVELALSLNVQHISIYGLKIEKGTRWAYKSPDNLPDIDEQADMYEKIVDILTKNGYKHYEISNFALEGFESKHNLSYWRNKNYYGFGLGASGYEGKTRYTNAMTFTKYFENNSEKSYSSELTEQEIMEEEIFLGLRCADGINLEDFNKKFKTDFNEKYGDIVTKYRQSGHFKLKGGNLFLTLNGMLISNEIFSEFIEL